MCCLHQGGLDEPSQWLDFMSPSGDHLSASRLATVTASRSSSDVCMKLWTLPSKALLLPAAAMCLQCLLMMSHLFQGPLGSLSSGRQYG